MINHISVEIWQGPMDIGLGAPWASLPELTPNDALVKNGGFASHGLHSVIYNETSQ